MKYTIHIAVALTLFIGLQSADAQVAARDTEIDATPAVTEPAPFVPLAERPAIYAGTYGSLQEELQDRIVYPKWAQYTGIQGVLRLRFTVDERGRVTDPEVLKGPDFGLHEATLTALKGIPFRPAMQGPTPVPITAQMDVRIEPSDGKTR